MKYVYTTTGLQDGRCKHRHATPIEAQQCVLKRHRRNPMSDRTVKRLYANGTVRLIDAVEAIEIAKWERKQK